MPLNTKPEVRRYYKQLRKNLSPKVKTKLDDKIAENLFALDEYKSCKTLLAFVSKDIEVDTERIITQAFSDGKAVAVPRCISDKIMKFYIIESYSDLESGYFGLLEPKKSCPELKDFNNSICLVPGLAYDKHGYRVGFGKGYYDRFLGEYKGVSVGVCYSNFIDEQLPKDEFDRPVDILITDNRIFRKDKGYG